MEDHTAPEMQVQGICMCSNLLLMGFNGICCLCSETIHSVKHPKTNVQPPWYLVKALRTNFVVAIKPSLLSGSESSLCGTHTTRKALYVLLHISEPELQLV